MAPIRYTVQCNLVHDMLDLGFHMKCGFIFTKEAEPKEAAT